MYFNGIDNPTKKTHIAANVSHGQNDDYIYFSQIYHPNIFDHVWQYLHLHHSLTNIICSAV